MKKQPHEIVPNFGITFQDHFEFYFFIEDCYAIPLLTESPEHLGKVYLDWEGGRLCVNFDSNYYALFFDSPEKEAMMETILESYAERKFEDITAMWIDSLPHGQSRMIQ